MIVTGYNQEGVRKLIEYVVEASVRERLVNKSDISVVETTESTISIKQVRELLQGLYLSPIRLRRIAILHDAHKLSEPAANALLKSLEEAPEYVRFIMVTPWVSRLPITILSRCMRVQVRDTSTSTKYDFGVSDMNHFWKSLKVNEFEHNDVEKVGNVISASLKKNGPSVELKMAAMRLVDYYRVKGKGGNEKLAREVLLMYLPNN